MEQVVVNDCGIFYYKPGVKVLHRLNGPAVSFTNGGKEYYCAWYKNDKLHCETGAAVKYTVTVNDGVEVFEEYWYEGNHYSKEAYDGVIARKKV